MKRLKILRLFLDCKITFKESGMKVFWKVYWKPKKELTEITLPSIKTPIFLRPKTSDIDVFSQIFLREEYRLSRKIDLSDINFIVDCGANIGLSALYFSKVFSKAKVIAVELEKNNFELLKKNVAGNSSIVPLHAGVWSENTLLKIPNLGDNNWEFKAEKSNGNLGQTQDVEGITIQSIIEKFELPHIDILKIDVEGAEYELFDSNADFFLTKTRILIIELHDWIRPGVSNVFFKALQKYKFNLFCSGENLVCELLHNGSKKE